MAGSPTTIQDGPWIYRQVIPLGNGKYPILLLLHGWTGDEQSMSIFAARFANKCLILSPRGLFPSPAGGYSWSTRKEPGWSGIEDFRTAGQALIDFVTSRDLPQANLDRIILIGFSQGAALALSMLLLFPAHIGSVAAIAGFLPNGAERYLSSVMLTGKKVFIAHGNHDEIVPIKTSHEAVEALNNTGADVAYCEEAVGHKLSTNCFRGLDSFIDAVIS